jgi:chromosome segregation ATPase
LKQNVDRARDENQQLLSDLRKAQIQLEQALVDGVEKSTERDALKKELESAKLGAAETEKKRADLAVQIDLRTKEREALGSERDALKKELEAAKLGAAETEKKRADLAVQIDLRTKERDQSRTERETLVKERDQLKKTAGDRASRIAELEAQVADQADRQKLIDEQMVRAETQLEMLKEFLQPAFQ